MNEQNPLGENVEQVFKALASDAIAAVCADCGATEWVVALDLPIDDVFLANYRCGECDA